MEIGMVGLGKIGADMARRLSHSGHRVAGHDRLPDVTQRLAAEGIRGAASLSELMSQLERPRTVWVMVPAGEETRAVLQTLRDLVDEDDIVVDGGNTDWREDADRAAAFAESGAHYVDVGVSGGIRGMENGYCLMVGGDPTAVERLQPALTTLATIGGLTHLGTTGAGHYVKMVHNAIEYGMMQSLAEGFEMLRTAPFDFDLPRIAGLWEHGSVVRSWLLELTRTVLGRDPGLDGIRGLVADSGEGRWAVQTAIEQEVPVHVLAASIFARFGSRQDDSFANKILAALRQEFGGHAAVPSTGVAPS